MPKIRTYSLLIYNHYCTLEKQDRCAARQKTQDRFARRYETQDSIW